MITIIVLSSLSVTKNLSVTKLKKKFVKNITPIELINYTITIIQIRNAFKLEIVMGFLKGANVVIIVLIIIFKIRMDKDIII